MLGLNIVEFAGDDETLIDERVNALCARLDELIASQQAGVIGWQVCSELAGVERIYAMRKKAVGLLGNAKGAAKPIPFAEDTCVPPEHLADYIAEFRALLDSHGKLRYVRSRRRRCLARPSGTGYVRSTTRDFDEANL